MMIVYIIIGVLLYIIIGCVVAKICETVSLLDDEDNMIFGAIWILTIPTFFIAKIITYIYEGVSCIVDCIVELKDKSKASS